jgi:hypothetical protein
MLYSFAASLSSTALSLKPYATTKDTSLVKLLLLRDYQKYRINANIERFVEGAGK